MERRDYLTREIEKLTAMIKKLLGLINDLDTEIFEVSINEINTDLFEQFGFNLETLTEMPNAEFLSALDKIDPLNTDLFAEALCELSIKINHLKQNTTFNSKELSKKALLALDFLDEKTRTFSFKRMELKKELQQLIANSN
jgi:hypothetical protein